MWVETCGKRNTAQQTGKAGGKLHFEVIRNCIKCDSGNS